MLYLEQTFNQTCPKYVHRSELLSLSPVILFSCYLAYTPKYTWSLDKIDLYSTQNIDLTANPTAQLPELVIQSNTLDYGLYQFKFQVDLTLSMSQVAMSNSIKTFIQIVPSGLNVIAIQNGIQSQLIGYNQAFSLSPTNFTVDLDNLILPSSLSFQFYCQTIQLNGNSETSNQLNLQTYKSNPSLSMKWNETCFASNSTSQKIIYFF